LLLNKKRINVNTDNNGIKEHIRGRKTRGSGKTAGEVLQQGSVIACDVPTPVYHQAARLRASRRGFITVRMQATSTSAEVGVAVPAQICFSYLEGCRGSESTGRENLCAEVQRRKINNNKNLFRG